MPTTAKKTAVKTPAAKTKAKTTPDAVQLLTADHKEVKKLFKDYEKLVKADGGEAEKQALAEHICLLLTVHAKIEEEIFYPAAGQATKAEDLLKEAVVEHASAKDLIAQIQDMEPTEDLYDAKVTVLGEYIDHHATEEEEELFPKVKRAHLDLHQLGDAMASRKEELMSELGAEVAA
ncbi:hemerythrin domain-containing protein [Aquabacterium sp.]|uniref:hemerythrin domain-containing protein n=1 Tax=Aquabacterium sp. TaxID=1872578 RepID=UPI00248A2F71|nr:hemerythrin domain-containing protein [Aquabacterium sp.]MDI1260398.1 hemerythrin domain-containing protein [Aquabacterium sp.]